MGLPLPEQKGLVALAGTQVFEVCITRKVENPVSSEQLQGLTLVWALLQ